MKHVRHDNPASVDDRETVFRELGCMEYSAAHAVQLNCVEQLLGDPSHPDVFLLTEHPPVFTLGRQGKVSGLLLPPEEIARRGVTIIPTERGGDITYHGPGQLVLYPIINLRRRSLSVTRYIFLLEEVMCRTTSDFGIVAARDSRNRGVWVGDNKIGSVGIRIRRGVSFHGISLNVSMSLEPFGWITPCGLSGVGVTSMEKLSGKAVSLAEVQEAMKHHIRTVFAVEQGENGRKN